MMHWLLWRRACERRMRDAILECIRRMKGTGKQ